MAATFDVNSEKANLNQYWYSPKTIDALVSEIQHNATRAAFLSTPSLYFALTDETLRKNSKVFEYDRQWENDEGFVFYDFNRPTEISVALIDAFDYVVVDPPFITREVWEKYMETVRMILKKDGKVLFTSVLENHGMLEQMMDRCLYVPLFRPTIPHLTYQYHCFLNYEATKLQFSNSELPPEDPKIRAALRMANDLRESEVAFTAQMQNRDREGEEPLPSVQRAMKVGAMNSMGERVMQWTHIPEGLTMYPNGAEAPPVDSAPVDYGPVYRSCEARRNLYDQFKKGIDQCQRILDSILKAQGKGDKEGALAKAMQERTELLASMQSVMEQLMGDSEKTAADVALANGMSECIAAYQSVELKKDACQELAADATRKYKSPIFNRQKELLAEMKNIKASAVA